MKVEMRIGKFAITLTQWGTIWMENEQGEGMEIRESELESAIANFFKERF